MLEELMQSSVAGWGTTWRKDDRVVTSLKEPHPQFLGSQEGTSKPNCINTFQLCPELNAQVGFRVGWQD